MRKLSLLPLLFLPACWELNITNAASFNPPDEFEAIWAEVAECSESIVDFNMFAWAYASEIDFNDEEVYEITHGWTIYIDNEVPYNQLLVLARHGMAHRARPEWKNRGAHENEWFVRCAAPWSVGTP